MVSLETHSLSFLEIYFYSRVSLNMYTGVGGDRRRESDSDSLELELQAVRSCLMWLLGLNWSPLEYALIY